MVTRHDGLAYDYWLKDGDYYLKRKESGRRLKTIFGEVFYWRYYLVKKSGGCVFYPLDALLGLTRDGFSPMVISLASRLATRMSFATSVILFQSFYGWSPSSEAIECLVLGLGRDASVYMEQVVDYPDEGEVLVIEVDGKASPTATSEELSKRRGKRKKKACGCNCQRHRRKACKPCRRKRRKKGDKSKNGRSATLVVMYTLKRGDDNQLHGPLNKKVWASFSPRRVMLDWARRQATRRGFPPDTDKRIHIVIDGERCLKKGLSELFPKASFCLDIRHLEEKLWKVGHCFHKEGSPELEEWVEAKRSLLYKGRAEELISQLTTIRQSLSRRAKRDKAKREVLKSLIAYMESRVEMLAYAKRIEEDLPIASGIVEGAARYVIGERLDCSGMRWIPERAEAVLRLRCIELNGEWNQFFDWSYKRWGEKLNQKEKVMVRSDTPIDLNPEPYTGKVGGL